ncbi:MAG: 1-acyl-sn-glycerol-3-phosphate acyltransferase [Firmicutes bacterium]|nr:1-acyl-sn-glycerol-3-phosphate acyltransferase [Bacillota bacterium]
MLYNIIRAIIIPFVYLLFWPKVYGKKNIPAKGCVIIYSNHTSMLDPVILGCLLPRRIHFMAKQELFKLPIIAYILNKIGVFPVKRGSADISAIKKSLLILKQGKVLGIFPEGTRNKSGEIQEFAHGTASIANRSKATTIPVALFNSYRIFKPIKVVIREPLNFEHYYEQRMNAELLEKMSAEMSKALLDLVPKKSNK